MKNIKDIKYGGFTVIELIVVIVIIAILASLTTVQLSRSQLVARDKERQDDVTTIANHIENVYRTGQPDGALVPSGDAGITNAVPLAYPSLFLHSATSDPSGQRAAIMAGLDQRALFSPLKKATSLVAATNSTLTVTATTAGGKTLGATSATDIYVYQPLDTAGTLCEYATGNATTGTGTSATTGVAANANQKVIAPRLVDNCIKFNIYYYSEVDQTVKTKASLYKVPKEL